MGDFERNEASHVNGFTESFFEFSSSFRSKLLLKSVSKR